MKLIILVLLTIVFGCYTRTTTYYDINASRVNGNYNVIFESKDFNCLGSFLLYNKGESKMYSGIVLSLNFRMDDSTKINDLAIKIRPNTKADYNYPTQFKVVNSNEIIDVSTEKFDEIKDYIINKTSSNLLIFFECDPRKFDTLHMELNLDYLSHTKPKNLNVIRTYSKSFYMHSATR